MAQFTVERLADVRGRFELQIGVDRLARHRGKLFLQRRHIEAEREAFERRVVLDGPAAVGRDQIAIAADPAFDVALPEPGSTA